MSSFFEKNKQQSRFRKYGICFFLTLMIMCCSCPANAESGEEDVPDWEDDDVCVDPALWIGDSVGGEIKLVQDQRFVVDVLDAILDVGMAGAFGSVLQEPENYIFRALVEFTFSRTDAGSGLRSKLFIPGVRCDDEAAVFVGLVFGSSVEWTGSDILSVEEGMISVCMSEWLLTQAAGADHLLLAVLTR